MWPVCLQNFEGIGPVVAEIQEIKVSCEYKVK